MKQLLAMYMEHGRESMLPALVDVERVAQVIAEGGGIEDYLALTGRPCSMYMASGPAKVATKASKGSPIADKKATEDNQQDLTGFTYEEYGRGYLLDPPKDHPTIGRKYFLNAWWMPNEEGWFFKKEFLDNMNALGATAKYPPDEEMWWLETGTESEQEFEQKLDDMFNMPDSEDEDSI